MIYPGTYSLTLREELDRKLHSGELDGNFKYLNNIYFNEIGTLSDPRDFIIDKSRGISIFKLGDPIESTLDSETPNLSFGYIDTFKTNLDQPVNGMYIISGMKAFKKFAVSAGINRRSGLIYSQFSTHITYDLNVTSSTIKYINFYNSMNGSPLSFKYGKTKFADYWKSYIENPFYFTKTPIEGVTIPDSNQLSWTADILNNGIVEFGLIGSTSKLDYSKIFDKWYETIDQYIYDYSQIRKIGNNQYIKSILAKKILDNGIVVYTLESGGILIGTLEKAQLYFDAVSGK